MTEDRVVLIRRQLQDLGATKLSWALERHEEGGHRRWEATLQAANEMGAPVEFPVEMDTLLREALHDGDLGPLQEGVWVMDLLSGHVNAPQPRLGDGTGAHSL
jgi:hypothetical protein